MPKGATALRAVFDSIDSDSVKIRALESAVVNLTGILEDLLTLLRDEAK